jgi:hypothetical protein
MWHVVVASKPTLNFPNLAFVTSFSAKGKQQWLSR